MCCGVSPDLAAGATGGTWACVTVQASWTLRHIKTRAPPVSFRAPCKYLVLGPTPRRAEGSQPGNQSSRCPFRKRELGAEGHTVAHRLSSQPSEQQDSAWGRRSRKWDFFPGSGLLPDGAACKRSLGAASGRCCGVPALGGALHWVTPGIRDLTRGCSSPRRPPH